MENRNLPVPRCDFIGIEILYILPPVANHLYLLDIGMRLRNLQKIKLRGCQVICGTGSKLKRHVGN